MGTRHWGIRYKTLPMTLRILGLDIGGANLKAATNDGLSRSVPFPLWKQPEKLASALAELIAGFVGLSELAVTMTGELCDCFETKAEGVRNIVEAVGESFPVRIWSTAERFVSPDEAIQNPHSVAAANWHALATFTGRFASNAILIDIGSTTADLIPIQNGRPASIGSTDTERLKSGELIYTGVKRTPLCALLPAGVNCAELFAASYDAHLLLKHLPEVPTDCDTADGRPATIANAHARIARMIGGDATTVSLHRAEEIAQVAFEKQLELIRKPMKRLASEESTAILSGSGEFLVRIAIEPFRFKKVISLTEQLGPGLASCAPAFAVAVLASEAVK